ncbi:MAG TPA: NAD(P)-binding domain-containing protein, partial [Burkholderiales bacterium]|nr:NAD(P)-binding domain-containing protein [Burkholderiales bacterium]
MSETIGVVGAGRMGLPIIGHLARKGFRTLATDLRAAQESEVKARGAEWAADEAALGRQCTVILVCVGFDREVVELFPRLRARPGSIVAVLSTVHPRTVQRLAREAGEVHVVDSTVCRGG